MKFFSKIWWVLILLFCIGILSLSLRGQTGNPNSKDLLTSNWQGEGPFELSPERGRFALVYSLVEEGSVKFSQETGKFASPDVAIIENKYVSLFAPLLSFAAVPGYLAGKYLGSSQVGAFAVVSLFALFNVIIIRSIAIRLGAHPIAATIGSLIFIFATPGFSYAVNLYQHHLSTFLVLFSIYLLIRFDNFWSLLGVFSYQL